MSPSLPGWRIAPSTARRLALLATLSSLLGGCATPSPKLQKYAAPADTPTAKLVMRGVVPAGDAFGVLVYDDAENCKGARLAGAGNASRNPTTVPLAAGGLTTVDFMHVKANRESCTLRWSFTPVAGKSYLVNGVGGATGCRASLLDASNPDAIVAAAGSVRRNEKGNACIPMAQARSITTAQGGQDQGAAVLRPGADADDLKGLIPQ
ncbi:MAG TPA: hypothetical protein VI032_13170 [Burkholderiaceae bacterium]